MKYSQEKENPGDAALHALPPRERFFLPLREMENRLTGFGEELAFLWNRTVRKIRMNLRRLAQRNEMRMLSLLILALTFLLLYISSGTMVESLLLQNSGMDRVFLLFGFLMIFSNILYFAWQTLLYFRYESVPAVGDEELPECTVIVPAYNEGKGVLRALESILKSDYPAEKLEIIAVDDGSRDDTWEWISRCAEESKGRIHAVRVNPNRGKRNAIYQGLRLSHNEIFVTVDSDSVVLPSSLRELVSPFARDPKLGGVAGNIRVRNLEDGAVPRMLDVNFAFSFDFIRSAQSVLRSVMCTPGALSAYRLSAIRPLMEEWVNQTFMGRPSGIGEDRAITSMLLRENWRVEFQHNAIAFTKMPTNYKTLCKMLIRWTRSDIRENLIMLGVFFRRFEPLNFDLLGLQLNLVVQSIAILLPLVFLPMAIGGFLMNPLSFLYYTVIGTMVWSAVPAVIYAMRYSRSESVWSFIYGLYSIPCLSWICVYSIFTVQNSKWMTRGAAVKQSVLTVTQSISVAPIRDRAA